MTIADIRKINPCYDPAVFGYFSEDWTGTALDVLTAAEVGVEHYDFAMDRLYVVLRPEWLDEDILILFTVWCLRSLLPSDSPEIAACEVAEKYANGQASRKIFAAAWKAAGYPAWDGSQAWGVAKEASRRVGWNAELKALIELLQSREDPE